jgi:uncharacterized lipoprotein YddW (UPF0748 family)
MRLFGEFAALAAFVALAVPALAPAQNAPPAFPREARAVWVATVGNIDWPSSKTLTPAQQRAQAITILDKCAAANINVVIFHVRPAGDAFYISNLEPWSHDLTNSQGTAPNPLYDPLQFWIEEAHKRGIELHAWFNPYRAGRSSTVYANNHIVKTHPDFVMPYGNDIWMDPGRQFVRDRTISVILDIVNRYDVDGVHFDDYFYPYPISGTPFPDDASYNEYLAGGGTMSRADWRRDNVNTLVKMTYDAIKIRKPWVKFGISPFGIWRPNNPPGITGLDAYAAIYADSRKWIREGWVDYFTPQLYWRIDPPQQSYPALLDWWIQQNWQGRHIWPGNFTSNIGSQFGDWPASEILNQIQLTRDRAGATGNVHFSMRALNGNWKGIYDLLRNGHYAQPALVPASPWLDPIPPAAPSLDSYSVSRTATTIRWHNQAAEPVRRWAVYMQHGTGWTFRVLPSTATQVEVPSFLNGQSIQRVGIAAIDRVGNESQRLIVEINSRTGG